MTHHEMSPTTGTTAALWPPSLPSAGVWGAVVLGSRLGGSQCPDAQGLDFGAAWESDCMGRLCLSFPVARGCQTCSLGRFFQGAWAGCWSPLPTRWHHTTAPRKAGQGWGSRGSRGCLPQQGPSEQQTLSWGEEGTLAPLVLSPPATALKEEGDISLARFSLFSPKRAKILLFSPETYSTGQRCSCPQCSAAFPCLSPPLWGWFFLVVGWFGVFFFFAEFCAAW